MSDTNHSVSITAPAKINLVLEILGSDAEGYHLLSTVFQALDLADDLTLTRASETSLELINNFSTGLKIETGADNLAVKAQKALEAYCQKELPCRIKLVKNIPAGGGLGGGSADAAAVLKGLNALYGLGLSEKEMLSAAARLGADVSFGILGGTALGSGRGEQLSPLPAVLPEYQVMLVIPSQGLRTPQVYSQWDAMDPQKRSPARRKAERFVKAAQSPHPQDAELLAALSNDLQPAAFELYPELAEIRSAMLQAGCAAAMLCGSGSTMFGLIPPHSDSDQTEAVKQKLSPWGQVTVTKFSRFRSIPR